MDETTTQGALDAELVSAEELAALAPRQVEALEDPTGSDFLAALDKGREILLRKLDIDRQLTRGLIELTAPEEWTINKTDDVAVAVPRASAVMKMARFVGIEMRDDKGGIDLEPKPVTREVDGLKVNGFTVRFQVRSKNVNGGAWLPPLEATRWEDEDFGGRQVDAAGHIVKRNGVRTLLSDLKGATATLAVTKGVGLLTGLRTIYGSQLLDVFGESGIRRCQKGHGFGSSTERTAGKVAEGGVPEKALALWEEILRRVGGDEDSARGLLKEVTAYPAGTNRSTGKAYSGFLGVDSYKAITREVAVQQALRNLKAHAVFGDDTAREPGED